MNAEEEVKSSSGGGEVLSEQPNRQIAQHNQYNLPLMQVRITEETGESYYSKSNNGSNNWIPYIAVMLFLNWPIINWKIRKKFVISIIQLDMSSERFSLANCWVIS